MLVLIILSLKAFSCILPELIDIVKKVPPAYLYGD